MSTEAPEQTTSHQLLEQLLTEETGPCQSVWLHNDEPCGEPGKEVAWLKCSWCETKRQSLIGEDCLRIARGRHGLGCEHCHKPDGTFILAVV